MLTQSFQNSKPKCQKKTKSSPCHIPTPYHFINFFSRFNTSGFPSSNPSQQPQQASTLVLLSGAHHSRWGVLSQPCVITPPMGVYGKSSLTPVYGQFAIPSLLWPISPFWCLMAFGSYPISLATHVVRPYPAVISLLDQFSTSPTPRPISLFWAWGSFCLPGASDPSSHL
ncbi:hypothetical protein O181_050961 [Austropuccinia psidii MF-1]|uniref:Uncharacterized protein n=1 Tax=Austropuccinia psidii MF-1 TaxID=1389203 RepID=A0A9Q3DVE7_9BASI|nr:hypothetical protein [Austropuccinia psidii MF-1]